MGLVFLCVYLRKYLVGSLQWVGRPICVCAAALAPLRRELINKDDQIDNLIFFFNGNLFSLDITCVCGSLVV